MSDWIGLIEDREEYLGFVYRITNLKTGQYYIGQKRFKRKQTKKPLKGRKNKRISYIDSDWKDYWGSSKWLLEDIEKYGKELFKREILHYCKSKSELNYMELKEQMDNNVLFDEKSYNGIINVRIQKSKDLMRN